MSVEERNQEGGIDFWIESTNYDSILRTIQWSKLHVLYTCRKAQSDKIVIWGLTVRHLNTHQQRYLFKWW
jgi:hypothetical protein